MKLLPVRYVVVTIVFLAVVLVGGDASAACCVTPASEASPSVCFSVASEASCQSEAGFTYFGFDCLIVPECSVVGACTNLTTSACEYVAKHTCNARGAGYSFIPNQNCAAGTASTTCCVLYNSSSSEYKCNATITSKATCNASALNLPNTSPLFYSDTGCGAISECAAGARGFASPPPSPKPETKFRPSLTLPGSKFIAGQEIKVTGSTLGEYVTAFYAYFVGIIGILAVTMILWGAIQWIAAAGNPGKIGSAKEQIGSALIGVLLALSAYAILNLVSPRLVKFTDLTSVLRPVTRIPQRIEAGERLSEGVLADATKRAEKDLFNAKNCPTEEEMRNGFEAYLTGYYRPGWGETGGYPSFECNVAMQCSCVTQATASCSVPTFPRPWRPCDPAQLKPGEYCNKTASGEPPAAFVSLAADANCFGFNTELDVSGSAVAEVNNASLIVKDRGSDIKGRHYDVFTGEGSEARQRANALTGKVTVKVRRFCDAAGNCKSL